MYTMHIYTMFLTCLYPTVSALNHAPQPYGLVPGREGALGSPVNNPPTTPTPLPTVTGTELGLLTLT